MSSELHLAVIGAGPAGLALALLAAQRLAQASVTVFDARSASHDIAADARTLALSLGSVQLMRRLEAWPETRAQPITEVRVSQAAAPLSPEVSQVRLDARDLGVPALGAVLAYGDLVQALQSRWLAVAGAEPRRLHSRFGSRVHAIDPEGRTGVRIALALPGAIDAGLHEDAGRFDLAVVAEGGVFAAQARKSLAHDYGQTAWVGSVALADAPEGVAFEHFTPQGPLALLPLPRLADGAARGALVWCVGSDADPVRDLDDAQRLAVLASQWPRGAGRPVSLSPLKAFALGLNAEVSLVGGHWGAPGAHRLVRIGNAAQTLHPVAGQGLNLGLRDAYALVQALRSHADVGQALSRVEWSRAPDRWSMIAITDFLARSFTWQLPGVAAARALGLTLLESAPPLKRALARQMMFGRR